MEKEEKAYLEELAVLNRHAKTTKDDIFDFTVESDVKRKEPPSSHAVEHEEQKPKKKKRKKDKRKDETAEERSVKVICF